MSFSIIVPVYQAEEYLEFCINSILEQRYSDWEVLLINDGSTDSSGIICDIYKDKDERIRVFHQENKGAAAARNVGLDNAKKEYIVFLDADDYIDEDYLYELSVKLREGQDICINNSTWWKRQDELGVRKVCLDDTYLSIRTKNELFEAICKVSVLPMAVCDVIWRREYVGNTRFDENYVVAEDSKFFIDQILHIESFTFLDRPMYFYRLQVTNSLTASHKGIFRGLELKIASEMYREMQKSLDITEKGLLAWQHYWQYKLLLPSLNASKNERMLMWEQAKKNREFFLHSDVFWRRCVIKFYQAFGYVTCSKFIKKSALFLSNVRHSIHFSK